MSRLALSFGSVLGVLVAFALPARAQPAPEPSVRLHVLADTVRVGERFEVALAVDHAPGRQILFPALPPASPETGPLLTWGDAEVLRRTRYAPSIDGAMRTDSLTAEVAVFAVDTARVGPVSIRWLTGLDTMYIESPSVPVIVASEAASATAAPDSLLTPEPFPDPRPVWAVLGVLGLALMAGAVWGLLRLRRRGGTSASPPPAPFEEVTERLERLDRETPAAAPHAVALSHLVRTYLERRLGLHALERTTREIDADLAAEPRVPPAVREALTGVLRQTDRVKFAEAETAPDERAGNRDAARRALTTLEERLRERERREVSESRRVEGSLDAAEPPR